MSQHIHLIGIGGSGLSAIARLLKEKGFRISGSDQTRSELTDELEQLGMQVFIGHAAENLHEPDLVIRSSAIPENNPELIAAREQGIPVYKRSEYLGQLLEGKFSLAVAGTHGKTTTTSMLAWTLTQMGYDPSYIIGGISKDLNCNAHAGSGEYFVIEADEYDNMFLGLNPNGIILTNVEYDHPDCFPTREIYLDAFRKFVHKVKPGGNLVVCADNDNTLGLLEGLPENVDKNTYTIHNSAGYKAENLQLNEFGGFSFDLVKTTEKESGITVFPHIKLAVPGKHNVYNASAVLIVISKLGLDLKAAVEALQKFSGTSRRFDVMEGPGNITFIDDYAHHPTEIKTTLEAAKAKYAGRRLVAVWQPHTFSRSKTFFREFAEAFSAADQVFITEVYAARETDPEFSAKQFADTLKNKNVNFIPGIKEMSEYLKGYLQENDVLIVLSAGSAIEINVNLLHFLKEKTLQVGNDGK